MFAAGRSTRVAGVGRVVKYSWMLDAGKLRSVESWSSGKLRSVETW